MRAKGSRSLKGPHLYKSIFRAKCHYEREDCFMGIKNGWRIFPSATHIHSQSGFAFVFFPLLQNRFYLGDQLFLVGHIQHIARGKDIV